MYLAEVLVSISVAAVVPHVDGGHLGDVQGAVIAKVLQHEEGEGRKEEKLEQNEEKDKGGEQEEKEEGRRRKKWRERMFEWKKKKVVEE